MTTFFGLCNSCRNCCASGCLICVNVNFHNCSNEKIVLARRLYEVIGHESVHSDFGVVLRGEWNAMFVRTVYLLLWNPLLSYAENSPAKEKREKGNVLYENSLT